MRCKAGGTYSRIASDDTTSAGSSPAFVTYHRVRRFTVQFIGFGKGVPDVYFDEIMTPKKCRG